MNPEVFITPGEIKRKYNISYTTLSRWADQGKITCRKTPGGIRRYNAADVAKLFGEPEEAARPGPRRDVCYARVSSDHQRPDLGRQAEDLARHRPGALLIKDVGSGLNWHRPGFKRLLDLVHGGKVATVVVAHRDRLCRFAFELVERIFEQAGVKVVVLSQGDDGHSPNPQQELADDLLAVTNHFVARNNGLRSAANRKRRAGEREIETGGGGHARKKHRHREDPGEEEEEARPAEGEQEGEDDAHLGRGREERRKEKLG